MLYPELIASWEVQLLRAIVPWLLQLPVLLLKKSLGSRQTKRWHYTAQMISLLKVSEEKLHIEMGN